MKKLRTVIPIVLLGGALFAGVVKCFAGPEVPPVKVIVFCSCCAGGSISGSANDCVTGSGNCIPTACGAGSTKSCGATCH
jgi:hypothetical protein